MLAHRRTNQQASPWHCFHVLIAIATLLGNSVIGMADDKKAASEKKLVTKKAGDEEKKPPVKKGVGIKKSPVKTSGEKKRPIKKSEEKKKPPVKKGVGEKKSPVKKGANIKKPPVKKGFGEKKPPVKKGVEKKPAGKNAKPAKVDKQKAPRRLYAVVNVPKSIKLTPEQTEQVAALDKEFAPKLAELIEKQNAIITPEQRKAGQEAVIAAKNAGKSSTELKEAHAAAVQYSDQQKQQLRQIKTEFKELHKTVQGKFNELLTEEQKSQLKNVKTKGSPKGGAKKVQPPKSPKNP